MMPIMDHVGVLIKHDGDPYKDSSKNQNQRDIITQSIISIALGVVAFLAFCVSLICDLVRHRPS